MSQNGGQYNAISYCQTCSRVECFVDDATPDEYIVGDKKWGFSSDLPINRGLVLRYPYSPDPCNQGWDGANQPPWGPVEARATLNPGSYTGTCYIAGTHPCAYWSYIYYVWGCT